ncbi:MAG: tRNA pseudouridine(55) synthase TruB [Thermoleophilaceae bacterium]
MILYPKEAGVTSHDVVARIRRRLPKGVKVGHAGTLDPFATGLLLVLVGRATRTQQYLLGLRKGYRVVARLGWTSDTGDRDGALTHTGRVPAEPHIPIGAQMQRPPAYSAVKVEGRRLYQLAREGRPREGEPRPVTVHDARLVERDGELATFVVECSSGTYVRQLVADLGDAYCHALQRTAVGPFRLEDSDPDRVIGVGEALAFIPGIELEPAEAARAGHGVGLALPSEVEEGPVRLTCQGHLVAIAEPRDRQLRPVVVFGS